MAKCIAKAIGSDTNRDKECHRLWSFSAEGQANTWHTFTRCVVFADGSGFVSVTQNNNKIVHIAFGAEDKEVELRDLLNK